MNTAEVNKFLKALDVVKKDFTCGVCLKLCEDPVTLSVCFHMVCSKHDVKSLKKCPTCNVSLHNCKIFVDERLKETLPATKALDEMFSAFRVNKENIVENSNTKSNTETKKRRAKKNIDIGEALQKIPSQSTNKDSENEPSTSKGTKRDIKKRNSIDNTSATDLNNSRLTKNKALEKRNNKGETALHIACRLGKIDKVIELLSQGANANTKDNAGWTPLHEAVQNGLIELVVLLLQHNALVNVPGQDNETPLHEAIRYNHIDIAEELVKNGADVNIRNVKGETPLQLAKGKMKEAIEKASENIIQTQTMNITHISEMQANVDDDIMVYCVSQNKTVYTKLKNLAKHHNNIQIEAKFTKKVTHLIVDASEDLICTSTTDVLQGIVYGLWILTTDWILKSTNDQLEPFEEYEVKGVGSKTFTGPKNARYNKYKQLPGIFDGCHFYLHNFHSKYEITKQLVMTKTILSKLITDAGGVMLRRVPNPELIPDSEKLVPYHAQKGGKLVNCSHYIIFKDLYEPMYNMSHLKALPVGWLIECLEKYELCEPW